MQSIANVTRSGKDRSSGKALWIGGAGRGSRAKRTYPVVRCHVASVNRPLRIALLSYRSKPHSGGQGVYVRHLSRELAALGHRVEVFSGQPYPELDPGPVLREVPSLDLYREDDPFRTPRPGEIRDWADVLETVMMWAGAFPEPLTFSIRALRELRARAGDFDVVHDNQGLGYGMLGVPKLGLPLVTSVHHPITVDKRLDLEGLGWWRRMSKSRWYGFLRMQGRVARRCGPLITVSESSKRDICMDFRVLRENVHIVPLGVDTRRFRPRDGRALRVPGRIVAVASSDHPLKGLPTLLRAIAKIVTERDVHLVVVGPPSDSTRQLAVQLSIADRVTFTSGLSDDEYAALLASAETAVVASMYEGFSLPAVEHMASGTPLIATQAGALPEVTGDAALPVAAGDPEELAAALRRMHDSPALRERLSRKGLDRVRQRFAWPAVAAATARLYRDVIKPDTASADRINGDTAC
ncbi:MAG: glycosyltransferase family 4 protein [Nocardiopsaceae bacterium]|nr:glycosyltransferase family 4 protein [Nocardiopsaceae bacterium]